MGNPPNFDGIYRKNMGIFHGYVSFMQGIWLDSIPMTTIGSLSDTPYGWLADTKWKGNILSPKTGHVAENTPQMCHKIWKFHLRMWRTRHDEVKKIGTGALCAGTQVVPFGSRPTHGLKRFSQHRWHAPWASCGEGLLCQLCLLGQAPWFVTLWWRLVLPSKPAEKISDWGCAWPKMVTDFCCFRQGNWPGIEAEITPLENPRGSWININLTHMFSTETCAVKSRMLFFFQEGTLKNDQEFPKKTAFFTHFKLIGGDV